MKSRNRQGVTETDVEVIACETLLQAMDTILLSSDVGEALYTCSHRSKLNRCYDVFQSILKLFYSKKRIAIVRYGKT